MSNKKNKSEPCISKERLADIAKDNPDLSLEFVEDILKAQQEVKEKKVESYENDKEKARKEEFKRMVKELMDQYSPVLKKLSKS